MPTLLPDEQALYEGSAESAPLTRGVVAAYIGLLGLAVLIVVSGWLSVRGMATTSWSYSLYSIQFRGSNATGTFTKNIGMINPLAFVILIIFCELHRQALVRSLILVVTARRVLLSSGVFRTRVAAYPRRGKESVALHGASLLVLSGFDKPLNLPGFPLAAREGIAHALETFEEAPVPDPPPPLWNPRRVAAVLLIAFLALSAWGVARTTAPPSLTANWKAGTTRAMGEISVRLDRPAWTNASGWRLERLVTVLDGAPPKAGFGASVKSGLFRAEERHMDFLPTKGREANLVCTLSRPDGSVAQVKFTLRPGGKLEKALD